MSNFNTKELIKRIATALILIVLVVAADFYLPQLEFAVVFSVLVFLAAWEWAGLSKWEKPYNRLLYAIVIFVLCFATLFVPIAFIFLIGNFWWLGIVAWLFYIHRSGSLPVINHAFVLVAGIFTLVPCWRALIYLHESPLPLLILLLVVWGTDTFAYFGGIRWGQRKLIPLVSPNKTWAGIYSAIGFTLIFSTILAWLLLDRVYFLSFTWLKWALPTIAATITGDLFESLLKRQRGIKDSGRWLPGHGGLLDRIDGLVAAAPIFATGWIMMMH